MGMTACNGDDSIVIPIACNVQLATWSLLYLREGGAAFGRVRLYIRNFNMGSDEYRVSSLPIHVIVSVLQFAVPEITSPG